METIKEAIYDTLKEQHPATCRGLFYALVSKGVIDKTETEYKSTVVRLTGVMRREGSLPYEWLADSTRWMRKPDSWDSIGEALADTAAVYRRNLWRDTDAYCEVWLEKDALAGAIFETTAGWDVPLMVSRGYASLTFLHSAAMAIAAKGKPTWLYYLGDHDPSGVDIPRKIEAELRRMAPNAEIHFERLAVNEDQITLFELQTRPTKKTDTRSAGFAGESVEVDAIPAPTLRTLVGNAISRHIDGRSLALMDEYEASERDTLRNIARAMGRTA